MKIDDLTNLIGSGAQADVYRVGDKAIKLFKEHCSKEEVFYEAAIHSMIEHTKLPIPKIYEVVQIDNRMAIVMDIVPGASLKDIIFNNLKDIDIFMRDFIDLQIQVHNVCINAIGFPSMKDRLIQRISLSSILSNEQKNRLLVLLDSFIIGNSLCHGDFHFLNLIKSDKGTKIIDWIDAASGNPEADVCRTYMLYALYFEEFADMYLSEYCKKTNKTKGDIIKWLPVIAGARLSEGNETERKRLLEWVDMK